jgi:hypothetical protein
MACLFLLVFLAFPGIALALFFFSNYLEHTCHGFLPLTTLAYAWMVNSG